MSTGSTVHLAVDLGASSGRVIAANLSADGSIEFNELIRFEHGPIAVPERGREVLYWDLIKFWTAVRHGIEKACLEYGEITSIGVDSWAVDYGLFNSDGALIGNPVSYRSDRTDGAPEVFYKHMSPEEHYSRTGIQFQKFNTVFQLVSSAGTKHLIDAAELRLIPDLLNRWLGAGKYMEITNASTTGLLSPATRDFDPYVLSAAEQAAGRPLRSMLGTLIEPGQVIGTISAPLLHDKYTGTAPKIVTVGSHDTASAVAAIPTQERQPFYISCGTWSLVGTELSEPCTSAEAQALNFTNELGVDNTIRFLKNVMGLWVFNECVRHWRKYGQWEGHIGDLVSDAAAIPTGTYVIDINDESLFPPGNMPRRIKELCEQAGSPVPDTPAEVTRCVVDSLALAYRRALRQAESFGTDPIRTVHMIGGGIKNTLLCQMTADAVGAPVAAGPIEATAMGNVGVQVMACGLIPPHLKDPRSLIAKNTDIVSYQPDASTAALWDEIDGRVA